MSTFNLVNIIKEQQVKNGKGTVENQ